MPLTRLVLDQTDHAESSTSGTLVSDCELIDVSGVLQMQIPDVLNDLDDVILTSPITDEVLQFNGSNWVNASVSGVGGGGNTLDEAYDEGGAGAGRIITADTGAVQIDGSNQASLVVNQAGNFSAVNITKSGSTLGNAVTIENDGTANGLLLDQDGNGIALNIDSEATSRPLINLAPLSTNTRGDIAFGTARTADPGTPSEGDVWYNATSKNLILYDGDFNRDLTIQLDTTTLDAAYDGGGAGVGRTITADAGAVEIDGSNNTALKVNQASNRNGIHIDKTGTGINSALRIENDGTGQAINATQNGESIAAFIDKIASGGVACVEFQNAGVGKCLELDQNGNGIGLRVDSEATSQPLIELLPLSANTRGDIAFSTARTADPSTPSEGDLWYQSTLEFLKYRDSAKNISLTGISRKSILVEDPTSSEDLTMFFTEEAITVRQVEGVLRGSSTPSVTISVMHNTDRNAAGNNVLTSATAITSVTTGDSPAIGGDVTIPADSFVWLETSAQSGTVDELNVTIKFTED